MLQSKRNDHPPAVHQCPVCQRPQTKIQRRLGEKTHGSTNYVCTRAADCSLGIDLSKVDTWVAV
jgi:ssDNA-binding Zn-finger/Zn-ribbon topoisomerase 1